MAAIWSGTLGALREITAKGNLSATLADGYRSHFGEASRSEVNSWKESIPDLVQALDDPGFSDIQVIIELQMPVGCERADIVLLGGTPDEPRAMVIELKQWTEAAPDETSHLVAVPGLGRQQHPVEQVLNYRGKLRFFHSRAAAYDLRAAVYLHNMNRAVIERLNGAVPPDVVMEAPMYGKDDAHALAEAVVHHLLPSYLDKDEHRHFADAPYEQTQHLFDVLSNLGHEIAERATSVLAEEGMGLTEEQELIVEEVLSTMKSGSTADFIVQGGPGSGKTLLAVTLLLRALQRGYRTKLAIRNNRLQAILRRVFDLGYRGASGMLMYFEVPRSGTGIGDERFRGNFDLVICDEAQRMRRQSMETVLKRAPVSAIFLDETQRLNPPEQGTREAFADASNKVGKKPELRELSAAVRCRGGQPYHDWVETLLATPLANKQLKASFKIWSKRYRFRLWNSVDKLIEALELVRDNVDDTRVALVAAFTESPGSMKSTRHPENLRIGYPLTSAWDGYRSTGISIPWLMKPAEYVSYWMGGGSNSLDRVASIYGAQGFESDYVGVIWGRDFVIRNGQWTLGNPNHCYDSIDGLVTRGRAREWSNEALDLVRSRYRIFLTRGIEGTFIFCEDPETRNHLLGLYRDFSPNS